MQSSWVIGGLETSVVKGVLCGLAGPSDFRLRPRTLHRFSRWNYLYSPRSTNYVHSPMCRWSQLIVFFRTLRNFVIGFGQALLLWAVVRLYTSYQLGENNGSKETHAGDDALMVQTIVQPCNRSTLDPWDKRKCKLISVNGLAPKTSTCLHWQRTKDPSNSWASVKLIRFGLFCQPLTLQIYDFSPVWMNFEVFFKSNAHTGWKRVNSKHKFLHLLVLTLTEHIGKP